VKQWHRIYLISVNLENFLAEKITDRNSDWALLNVTFLCETWRKCISNCSTANVLCKQFRTRWCRGSCFMSSLREKHWRNPQGDPHLNDKPTEKLPWLKMRLTRSIPDTSFVSSVLVRSITVNGSLGLIIGRWIQINGKKRTSMQLRLIIQI